MRKTVTSIFIAACLLPAVAAARTVFYHVWGCPAGGGTGSSMGVIDDATGNSYLIIRGCDGTRCTYPLYGPFSRTISPAWRLPVPSPTWSEMTEAARLNTGPGAYVGLWLLTDTGDTVRFRNPVDEQERMKYIAMWENEGAEETRSNSRFLSSHELNDLVANDFISSYRNQQQTTEQQARQRLIDRYWNNRFGDRMPAPDELQEVTDVTARLAVTHQTLVLNQSPSPSNGQQLIIAPLVPAFAGTVRIINAAGTTVWQGEVHSSTTIIASFPAGTYFIQGEEGKPLVVNIVR